VANLALIVFLALGQATQGSQQAPPVQDPQTAPAATTTFTDPILGLSFTHSPTWVRVATPVATGEKPKPRRLTDIFKRRRSEEKKAPEGAVTFSIPGAGGVAPAELTIVRASFSAAPEKWQEIQADANRNLHRNVERQWQQEILNVPLLLTRISYAQDGVPTTTVTGLLYNAAPDKLLFRLTGPTSAFDATQYEFTQAMETLRTTSDTLPSAQEPGKELVRPPTESPDAKHNVFARPKAVPPKVAPLSLAVSIGGRRMVLRVPQDWTLASVSGDTASLRHPDLKEPVTVTLFSAATAPRPTDALTEASKKTLAEYKTVALREDTPGTPNKAGNPVLAVWRRGEGPSGPLATLDAIASVGDYYLMFSFRPRAGDDFKDDRRTVQTMLDAVGLEPAP